jgi:LacI family transcriptional regulator
MTDQPVAAPSFKRPTLVDIARVCGLSRATVARALSGKGYVDPERRVLIQETANRLGYRTSTIARALRTQRSSSIGVMIADITNPIFPQIVKGIDEVLSADDHTIFLCNTDEDPAKQEAIVQSLLDRQVDGIILVSQSLTERFLALLENAPPCVYVNRRPASGALDYVGPDNAQGIALLLDHLLGLGHQRIAYIAGPKLSSTAQERLAHFRLGMAERGLAVDESLVLQGNYNIESGIAAAQALLALDQIPTAIIAANDLVAIGVITCCIKAGLRVPEDISVTGFDDAFDIHLSARYPLEVQGITTVDQPKRALGHAAGRLLLQRIADPAGPPNTIILPTVLKVRHTTGAPSR